MIFVDYRIHDSYLPMYGYLIGSQVVYWSMKFYEDTWHAPLLFNPSYRKPANDKKA